MCGTIGRIAFTPPQPHPTPHLNPHRSPNAPSFASALLTRVAIKAIPNHSRQSLRSHRLC
eukprot:2067704-Prymnesium_polylepis.1